MITVYKYPFEIADHVAIDLPEDARILKVETQDGQPCLWALVDTDRKSRPARFVIFGTGHPINRARYNLFHHVATFQQGPFVWHMFSDALSPS